MRWLIYLLLLIVVGILQMWPALDFPRANAEFLFLIALHTALHCPRSSSVPAFFAAGLVRDVFIGTRLGAGALTYTLAGILLLLLLLRGKVEGNHIYMRLVFVFLVLSVLLVLLALLEGFAPGALMLEGALRDALYTALLGPFMRFALEILPLHSWQDDQPALTR